MNEQLPSEQRAWIDEWLCEACGKPLNFVPRTCCSGHECGCMGQPIDPPVCSQECFVKAYPHMQRGQQ